MGKKWKGEADHHLISVAIKISNDIRAKASIIDRLGIQIKVKAPSDLILGTPISRWSTAELDGPLQVDQGVNDI